MITKKYYKLIRVSYEDSGYLVLTNVSSETGEFYINAYGNSVIKPSSLQYSLNYTDWETYDLGTLPHIEVPAGGHIYLRGNNENGFCYWNSDRNYCNIRMTVAHTASGNPFSLRNADPAVFSTYTSVLYREFRNLFGGDNNLTDISGLVISQITQIGNEGMQEMFNSCYGITKGLDLKNVTSIGSNSCDYIYTSCRNIANVTAPNISTWNIAGWLSNNAGGQATGTKTVYAPTGLVIPTDSESGIPSGWTRVDY